MVREVRMEGGVPASILLEKYGTELELLLPAGPAGERDRAAAARLERGAFVSVISRHLGGNRFESVRLLSNPHRHWKLLVSAIAAVAVAALFPVFFRASAGGFIARAGPRAAGASGA